MELERVHVDHGCRGHDYDRKCPVFIAGGGPTPTMERESERRSAPQATIANMTEEGRLGPARIGR
jgi:hypothetical protein